jgi:hypothetical protein
MGLDGDFLQWLQDTFPNAFHRDTMPGLVVSPQNPAEGTRMIIEAIDVSGQVFKKAKNVSKAYEWALSFRTYIEGIINANKKHIETSSDGANVRELVIVLHADGQSVTLAKSATRLARKKETDASIVRWVNQTCSASASQAEKDEKISFLKYSLANDSVIPSSLHAPLDELWSAKISHHHHRTAAMQFLIDSVVKGFPGTDIAGPIDIPDFCSIVVYPMDSKADDQMPRLYTRRNAAKGGAPFDDGGMIVGEGDFIGVQFALQVRKLQYQYASAMEPASSKHSNTKIPIGWISLHINSNDSDLLVICSTAQPILEQQKIDVVINLGFKASKDEVSAKEFLKLSEADQKRVVYPPPPPPSGPGSRTAQKTPFIERFFNLYVDVRQLSASIQKQFNNPWAAQSIAFVALISGSDLVPKKVIGGCSLRKMLDILKEENICVIRSPSNGAITWTPDRGLVRSGSAAAVGGSGGGIVGDHLTQLDEPQFCRFLEKICRNHNKPTDPTGPLSAMISAYNSARVSRPGNQTIEVDDVRVQSLKRGLYALHYYSYFGWNSNLAPDDPCLWGWKKGDVSNGESYLMPRTSYK